MVIHTYCNLSKMKNKILLTCLQGNYRDSLGEFSNMSYGVFMAERYSISKVLQCSVLNCILSVMICMQSQAAQALILYQIWNSKL